MKKIILATSIMFSTLVLGTNVLVDSTTKVLAINAEQSEVTDDKDIVQNKIRFVEEDGAYVATDEGKNITTYTGKKGDVINLKIPSGYSLSDSKGKYYFDNSELVREIIVTPREITNTINFLDDNFKSVGSIKISGKTNSKHQISETEVPKGYYFKYDWEKNFTLSALNKNHTVHVTDQQKVSNVVVFVDENGTEIKRDKIEGRIGTRVNISDTFFEYDEYKLAPNQSENVVLKENNSEIKVNVVSNKKSNKLVFKDSKGSIVSEKTISGGIGRSFVLRDFLPDGYRFLTDQDYQITIEKDNAVKEYTIAKTTVKNKLIFKDENGKKLKEADIEGTYNGYYYIDDYLPDDYGFVDSSESYLELKEDGSSIEIKIKKIYATNSVIFKDTAGKVIHQEDVRGVIGETKFADEFVPKGYHVKDKTTFVTDDKGTKFEFVVVSNELSGYFTNEITYVNEKGKVVSKYSVMGEYDDEQTVDDLKGYQLLSNKKIKIKAKEGYVHKILVKTLSVKSKLTLVDYFTDEILDTMELTQLNGTEITNNQIPNKYKIPKSDEHYVDANHTDQKIRVKRVVKTNINFIDSKGKIISSQKEETLDKDDIKLKVPKGYKQATGNGYITADHRADNYNVLVVPTSESADKPSTSKPNPTPTPQPGQTDKDKNSATTQVNFLDKHTKKTVHTYKVQGKHGQTVAITTPAEYELTDSSNSKLTLDKSKKSVDIYVVKKNTAGTTTNYSTQVLTKLSMTRLFDKNGKQIGNRALDFNSGWKTDQKLLFNGVMYYRVATNEYVKASEVIEYTPISSKVQTKLGSAKYLFDMNGKQNKSRALAANTAWFTDRSATINGEKMYRVATNEWLKASDTK